MVITEPLVQQEAALQVSAGQVMIACVGIDVSQAAESHGLRNLST
jgi:hypothetical protein